MFFLLFILLFYVIQKVLTPNWDFPVQIENHTAKVKEYDALEPDTVQALFLGTSHVQAAVSPMDIYENYHLVTYNEAVTGMRMPATYFQLRRSLFKHTPSVVMLDVSALYLPVYYGAAWLYLLDSEYPLSREKWEAVIEYAQETAADSQLPEKEIPNIFIRRLFPLLYYKTRWKELKTIDFDILKSTRYKGKGFTLRTMTEPVSASVESVNATAYEMVDPSETSGKFFDNGIETSYASESAIYQYEPGKEQLDWLMKIRELCEERGIRLCLFKVPVVDDPRNYDSSWTELKSLRIHEIADEMNVDFLDIMYDTDIELDLIHDYVDNGDHMNYAGARKVSAYLGQYLLDKIGLEPKTDSYYEDSLNVWKKLEVAADLATEYDGREYLRKLALNAEGKTILFAMHGSDDQDFSREDYILLKSVGILSDYSEDFGKNSFIAVIKNGMNVYEEISNTFISKSLVTEATGQILLSSMGVWNTALKPAAASIIIGTAEYTENETGLNIVVYDNETKLVIDSVCISADGKDEMLSCKRNSIKGTGYTQVYEHQLYVS